jgi:hypothetical protein
VRGWNVKHQGVQFAHASMVPYRSPQRLGNSLLIYAPATIMGMYTDWGNLKIVSCEAWLNGAGPGSSTGFRWNGRVGGVHFWVKARAATSGNSREPTPNRAMKRQLGDAEKFR